MTNADGSLVGPWNAMVSSPLIGGLAERMGSFCRHHNACAAVPWRRTDSQPYKEAFARSTTEVWSKSMSTKTVVELFKNRSQGMTPSRKFISFQLSRPSAFFY